MALQTLGLGTTEGDGTGDSIRDGGDKINDNFSEIYTLLGTGTALSSGISATATVVTLAAPSITGVASFADGSVSAPSITNTGDTNTGIFFSAADTVNVTTGGTERIEIDSSGLDVTGNVTATGTITAATAFVPDAQDGAALGTTSLQFSDLFLADSAVIGFGDDNDTTLTHTDGAGLTLNSTNKLMFNDVSQFIQGASATVLDIAATDEIELTATLINVVGALTSSGLVTANGGIVIPNDADIGSAGATDAMQISSGGIVTFKDDILIKDGGTIGVASATSAMTIASTGIVTFVDDILIKDTGTIGTATTPAAVTIAANGNVTFSGSISSAGSAFKEQGKETVFIPAGAIRPTISNGCAGLVDVETTAGRPDMQVLDFDASADEAAQFQIAFPKSWNGGTITFQVFWTTAATDTDGVAWGLQGVAASNNDTIDVAYGTTVVVTDDALGAAEDLCVTAESGAVTIAGSPAAADMCYFRIFRDISDGNDDMAEDARLIGVKLFFTTDAANDA